jgi:hypothetical protein
MIERGGETPDVKPLLYLFKKEIEKKPYKSV